MIDDKSVQRALTAKGYKISVDGVIGPASRKALRAAVLTATALAAVASWGEPRVRTAFEQIMLKDLGLYSNSIDGLAGPDTRYAYEKWQDHLRDIDPPDSEAAPDVLDVPRQANVEAYYGAPGTNHVDLILPYPMRVAWDLGSTIRKFAINKKAAPSARRVLERVLTHYGQQKIVELRLDIFSGCYNNRAMRGGKRKSMHAYAIAIDIDSEHNQFRWGRDRASLAQPQYDPWWEFWEDEGWVSLGRERNYDWMHVQRARL